MTPAAAAALAAMRATLAGLAERAEHDDHHGYSCQLCGCAATARHAPLCAGCADDLGEQLRRRHDAELRLVELGGTW